MIGLLAGAIPVRLYLYAGAVLLATGVVAGAYVKGRIDQKDLCQEAALQAKIAGLERDLRGQRTADIIEDIERKQLKELTEKQEAEIAAYEIELQTRADPACALSPADIDRLYGGQR